MKFKIILLLIICIYVQNVNSISFTDYIASKFTELADSFAKSFVTMTDKLSSIFFTKRKCRRPMTTVMQRNGGHVTKKYIQWKKPSAEQVENVYMTAPQLITYHRRRVETHTVTTTDGYFLTLHRIPSPDKINSTQPLKDQTVLLHHGLLGSSADWILNGPNKSLAYMLSDLGCDVWMANARGNYYSRGHVFKKSSPAYWNFTFKEIGQYDLSSEIDYIFGMKKNLKKINLIGHSMGASAILVLLSNVPKYNDLIRMAILIGPLAHMTNIHGSIKWLTALSLHSSDQIIHNIFGRGEFLPATKLPKWLVKYNNCNESDEMCSNPLFFLTGRPRSYEFESDKKLQQRILHHAPASGSTRTIVHYTQCAQAGKFKDFGSKGKDFNLGKITSPLAIISSTDDWVSTISDAQSILAKVKHPMVHHIIHNRNITHSELIWGSSAVNTTFTKVISILINGLIYDNYKKNEVPQNTPKTINNYRNVSNIKNISNQNNVLNRANSYVPRVPVVVSKTSTGVKMTNNSNAKNLIVDIDMNSKKKNEVFVRYDVVESGNATSPKSTGVSSDTKANTTLDKVSSPVTATTTVEKRVNTSNGTIKYNKDATEINNTKSLLDSNTTDINEIFTADDLLKNDSVIQDVHNDLNELTNTTINDQSKMMPINLTSTIVSTTKAT
ncbi:hypothetical protein JYU34_000560 [Plutella xylostella]|uniref:Partial AB-hydrolase lipase domain-containing protein n=1 Tax=Plutella xylostella TaxID=51655 RepID=A0ABQ7R801_PLUXY|nr:hypothetical protein JYU34_000560 [Plutella xylostella]